MELARSFLDFIINSLPGIPLQLRTVCHCLFTVSVCVCLYVCVCACVSVHSKISVCLSACLPVFIHNKACVHLSMHGACNVSVFLCV